MAISVPGVILIALSCFVPGCAMPDVAAPPGGTTEDYARWVSDTIEYRWDGNDEWALPDDVMSRGYGDCEDMALLLLSVVESEIGIEGELVLGVNEQLRGHAWVDIDGVEWEAVSGTVRVDLSYAEYLRLSYGLAIAIATVH